MHRQGKVLRCDVQKFVLAASRKFVTKDASLLWEPSH